jgi:hypothetical protein
MYMNMQYVQNIFSANVRMVQSRLVYEPPVRMYYSYPVRYVVLYELVSMRQADMTDNHESSPIG